MQVHLRIDFRWKDRFVAHESPRDYQSVLISYETSILDDVNHQLDHTS